MGQDAGFGAKKKKKKRKVDAPPIGPGGIEIGVTRRPGYLSGGVETPGMRTSTAIM